MGGVDKSNKLVAFYRLRQKSRRWYMPLCYYLVDVCISNLWIFFTKENVNEAPIQQKQFRLLLTDALIDTARISKPKDHPRSGSSFSSTPIPSKKRKLSAPMPYDQTRFDDIGHYPQYLEQVDRGRCRYCSKNITEVHCIKCGINLCFTKERIFFYLFHNREEQIL